MNADGYSRQLAEELNGGDLDAATSTFREVRSVLNEKDATSAVMMAAQPEEAGLLAYTLVVHLLRERDEPFLHYVAASLLATSLCYLPRAYDAALYHAKVAASLAPNEPDYHWLIVFIASSPDPDPRTAQAARVEAVRHLERIADHDEATRRKLRQHGHA